MTQMSMLPEIGGDDKEKSNALTLCLAVVPKNGFAEKEGVVQFPLYWLVAGCPIDELINAQFMKALEDVLVTLLRKSLFTPGAARDFIGSSPG